VERVFKVLSRFLRIKENILFIIFMKKKLFFFTTLQKSNNNNNDNVNIMLITPLSTGRNIIQRRTKKQTFKAKRMEVFIFFLKQLQCLEKNRVSGGTDF